CTQDVCAAGVCTHPNQAAGSGCGSPSDSDCDNPDTCDGLGHCQVNHEADGAACTSDGIDCTQEVCAAGVCTHPNQAAGFSCGSPSDRDCDNPDTCDGLGHCQVNHEADGTACTSDGNDCSRDVCAAGVCTHPNEPNGTTCNDGNACTTNDTCTLGRCIGGPPPNCNDGNPCTTDSCNPSTGCVHATVATGDNGSCSTLTDTSFCALPNCQFRLIELQD